MLKACFGAVLAACTACGSATPAQTQHPQLDRVDAAVAPMMREGHFPGVAVAVLRDGAPIHVGTYGLASLEHDVPVTDQTVFELASLTKAMTALAVMRLVEAGALRLDDSVATYIDDTPPAWADITVGQLLSHTAGLAHRFEARPNGSFQLDYSEAEMLASAMATPMVADPGTDWSYADQGYFLAGLVIEAVTGQSYADYMQTTYFTPLGLTQTGRLDQSAIIPHRAQGYAWSEDGLVRNRRVWQFGQMAHFGTLSSLANLMRWEAELVSPTLVDPAALAATQVIQRPFDVGESCERWGYARGWMTYVPSEGERVLSHGGYSGTAYLRDLAHGVSVIVLTNREDAPNQISPLDIAWAVLHEIEPSRPREGLHCWE